MVAVAESSEPELLTSYSKWWYRGMKSQPGSAGRVLSFLGTERIAWEKVGASILKMYMCNPEPKSVVHQKPQPKGPGDSFQCHVSVGATI